jgi:hypothetical protein
MQVRAFTESEKTANIPAIAFPGCITVLKTGLGQVRLVNRIIIMENLKYAEEN